MLFTSYRYIVKELLWPFIMGVFVFTFILIMFQILRFTEFMVVHGVDFLVVFKLVYYLTVAFLPITVPVSFLFSVLMVFSRLSGDNEITAFKASGISIYQLMYPVLFVSLIAGITTFYVSFYEGPWGNRNFENTLHKVGSAKATIQLKEGFFNDSLVKDFMLYAAEIDSENGIMKKLFIYDERDRENPVAVTAKKAMFEVDGNTKRTELLLYSGYLTFLRESGDKYRRAGFDEYKILLHEGSIVGDMKPNPPSLTYSELKGQIEKAKKEKDSSWYNKMSVEFHRRFAIPFACLIFGFLGITFGNTTSRSMHYGAGMMSFIVMVFYWVIYIAFTSMGSKGMINPILSVWIANIMFSMFSMYLFFRKT
jgi:lipopolysaccharide export system permease protein